MTVSDMDRSVAFYSDVLAFKPISDVEVDGPEYDQLWGIFGVRTRVVRMQLGEQQLELIEFLAPPTLAFTYMGSGVVSAQWPLIAAGAATVLFYLAMPKLLTKYRTGAFARLFLGPPPVPTLASTRRVEIPLQVRCTGCGATMPTA